MTNTPQINQKTNMSIQSTCSFISYSQKKSYNSNCIVQTICFVLLNLASVAIYNASRAWSNPLRTGVKQSSVVPYSWSNTVLAFGSFSGSTLMQSLTRLRTCCAIFAKQSDIGRPYLWSDPVSALGSFNWSSTFHLTLIYRSGNNNNEKRFSN